MTVDYFIEQMDWNIIGCPHVNGFVLIFAVNNALWRSLVRKLFSWGKLLKWNWGVKKYAYFKGFCLWFLRWGLAVLASLVLNLWAQMIFLPPFPEQLGLQVCPPYLAFFRVLYILPNWSANCLHCSFLFGRLVGF